MIVGIPRERKHDHVSLGILPTVLRTIIASTVLVQYCHCAPEAADEQNAAVGGTVHAHLHLVG